MEKVTNNIAENRCKEMYNLYPNLNLFPVHTGGIYQNGTLLFSGTFRICYDRELSSYDIIVDEEFEHVFMEGNNLTFVYCDKSKIKKMNPIYL